MGKAFDQLIGRTIAGKFLVEGLIGSGAMGAVYRARQVALEKTVAIKVLHGEHADEPSFAARFQREAKAASRLEPPELDAGHRLRRRSPTACSTSRWSTSTGGASTASCARTGRCRPRASRTS